MGNAIKKDVIHAEGIDIGIYTSDYENEFISLTDIAKKREGEYPGYVIQNWMRNRSVISFIGLWEALHNPNFNCLEFEAIKNEAVVALGMIGCKRSKSEFMLGYNEMLSRINPEAIICFGSPFPEMEGRIITIDYLESRKVVR